MSAPLRAELACGSLVALFAISGCALNSALEVEMKLPYAGGADLPRARVDVSIDDREFSEDWIGNPRIIEIGPGAPACETGGDCNLRFSVVTEQTGAEYLRVKIRFCDSDCGDDVARPGSPELWFELEEPFVHGGRTHWSPSSEPFVRVPLVQPAGPPSAPIVVPRCEIADDCWPSDIVPTPDVGYCNMAGLRYCEAGITPR